MRLLLKEAKLSRIACARLERSNYCFGEGGANFLGWQINLWSSSYIKYLFEDGSGLELQKKYYATRILISVQLPHESR